MTRTFISSATVARHRTLAAVLWPLAIMVMGHLIFRSYFEVREHGDFMALYTAGQRFLEGESVYANAYFLLTPSGLLAMVPFGLLPAEQSFVVANTLSIIATLAGVVLSVRFVGARLFGPLTAAVLLGFALTESLTLTWLFGNFNNTLLFALGAGFVLAASRDKHVIAGVFLGLALALKPLFVLVLLVPLLRRHWSSLIWAVAIPAVLNIVGLLVVPHPGDFFSVTVPNLLHAREGINNSLWAVGTLFGAPVFVINAARLLVVILAMIAVWRLRHLRDPVVRVGTSYAILVTAIFLASSLSETYYSMTLLPALLLVAAPHDSPMCNPLAWFAVYGFFGFDQWVLADHPAITEAVALSRPTIAWALLFLVMVFWALRHSRTTDLTKKAAGQPDDEHGKPAPD